MESGSALPREEIVVGAVAGLAAGILLAALTRPRGTTTAGLLDLGPSETKLTLHLVLAVLLGGVFGAIVRHRPRAYAAAISGGLLLGLLWWMVGPLTLKPLLEGRGPTWSVEEANTAFPSLIGALLYGGLTGLLSHASLAVYLGARSPRRVAGGRVEPPTRRVVILGGGFGGVGAAQRLERLFRRDPSLEITLVSSSNYLLFTPMLAEVASSALQAQHISAPLRASCPRTRFRHAEVESIERSTQVVRVRASASASPEALPYDHLVLALGAVPSYHGLPGLEENSFTLKTLEDKPRASHAASPDRRRRVRG